MAANGPRPIDLTTADWQRSRTDAELVAAIREGRGAMPPFADVLSDEQVKALAAHVRTLKRP
jgi:mono/diheme cytochrome c family protein